MSSAGGLRFEGFQYRAKRELMIMGTKKHEKGSRFMVSGFRGSKVTTV